MVVVLRDTFDLVSVVVLAEGVARVFMRAEEEREKIVVRSDGLPVAETRVRIQSEVAGASVLRHRPGEREFRNVLARGRVKPDGGEVLTVIVVSPVAVVGIRAVVAQGVGVSRDADAQRAAAFRLGRGVFRFRFVAFPDEVFRQVFRFREDEPVGILGVVFRGERRGDDIRGRHRGRRVGRRMSGEGKRQKAEGKSGGATRLRRARACACRRFHGHRGTRKRAPYGFQPGSEC